jgi:segregation and condensation protein B
MVEEKYTDQQLSPHREPGAPDLSTSFGGQGAGFLIPHIEALIFASDKPLNSVEITELINAALGFMDDKVEQVQIESAIEGIVEKYNSEYYPFEVKMSGGGWQFLTKKGFHKTVAQLNGEKFLKRLSAAALETLAIIAYKQPITKGEVESIRGVNSDYTVQKLLEKELVIISGRNEKLPGHPLIYATSKGFMDYFGINSSSDLPKIKEVLSEGFTEPTLIDFLPDTISVKDYGDPDATDTRLSTEETPKDGNVQNQFVSGDEFITEKRESTDMDSTDETSEEKDEENQPG